MYLSAPVRRQETVNKEYYCYSQTFHTKLANKTSVRWKYFMDAGMGGRIVLFYRAFYPRRYVKLNEVQ